MLPELHLSDKRVSTLHTSFHMCNVCDMFSCFLSLSLVGAWHRPPLWGINKGDRWRGSWMMRGGGGQRPSAEQHPWSYPCHGVSGRGGALIAPRRYDSETQLSFTLLGAWLLGLMGNGLARKRKQASWMKSIPSLKTKEDKGRIRKDTGCRAWTR